MNEAMGQMLLRGYAGTSVEDICRSAGVKKGTFFHHFPSKEALAIESLRIYRERGVEAFAGAPFTAIEDPLARVLGYLDHIANLVEQPEVPAACLFGNLSQEVAPVSPSIQGACRAGLDGWATEVAEMLDAARAAHPPAIDFSSESLGHHFVAIYEGALVLAKALADRRVIGESLRHLRSYIELLFEGGQR